MSRLLVLVVRERVQYYQAVSNPKSACPVESEAGCGEEVVRFGGGVVKFKMEEAAW